MPTRSSRSAGSCCRRSRGSRQPARAGFALDQWFDAHRIELTIVGEVEDVAMPKTLGEHGLGLFAAVSTKERVLSFRDANYQWNPKNQRPELWNLSNARTAG